MSNMKYSSSGLNMKAFKMIILFSNVLHRQSNMAKTCEMIFAFNLSSVRCKAISARQETSREYNSQFVCTIFTIRNKLIVSKLVARVW